MFCPFRLIVAARRSPDIPFSTVMRQVDIRRKESIVRGVGALLRSPLYAEAAHLRLLSLVKAFPTSEFDTQTVPPRKLSLHSSNQTYATSLSHARFQFDPESTRASTLPAPA
jgi:hypothetical protein